MPDVTTIRVVSPRPQIVRMDNVTVTGTSGGGSFLSSNTARVDPEGDDGTGTVGDLTKPFLTVQGAINAIEALDPIPASPVIDVGNNVFTEDVVTTLAALVFVGAKNDMQDAGNAAQPFNSITISNGTLLYLQDVGQGPSYSFSVIGPGSGSITVVLVDASLTTITNSGGTVHLLGSGFSCFVDQDITADSGIYRNVSVNGIYYNQATVPGNLESTGNKSTNLSGASDTKYPTVKAVHSQGYVVLETESAGTLTIGQIYKIATYHSGDDFTNVGAASNATGVIFTATGTTPTDWSHTSRVERIEQTGVFIPQIVAYGRLTGLTANNSNILEYTTPGNVEASYEIAMTIQVVSGTISTNLKCDYQNEANDVTSVILPVMHLDGTFQALVSGGPLANESFSTPVFTIRTGTATPTIKFYTTPGTFTTVVYNVEAIVKRIQ